MSVLSLYASHDFEGMHLNDAAKLVGHTRGVTRNWLRDRGWRIDHDFRLMRTRGAQEVADEIQRRIQNMRPSTPCFRCGAREGCKHR